MHIASSRLMSMKGMSMRRPAKPFTLKHPHLGGDEGDGGAVDDIGALQARGHDLAQLVPAVRLEALPPPRQPAVHRSNQV